MPAWSRDPGRGVAGIEAKPGDHHVDVVIVGVDRDPTSETGITPVLELTGDHRPFEQAGAVERVADGAGAVIAMRSPARMAAAPYIWAATDVIGELGHVLDRLRGGAGSHRPAAVEGGAAGRARPHAGRRERPAFDPGPAGA